MKLNKFLIGLLMTPAVALVGCSDYEDTESVSPQANSDATGAYFSAASTSITMHPESTSFTLSLNRLNEGSLSVPVTVTSNKDNYFTLSANNFTFTGTDKTSAPITVTYNAAQSVLQKSQSLALQIMDGQKDHPYASGYTNTAINFTIDYEWDSYASTMVHDEYAETAEEGILATVQYATDFAKDSTLVRIDDLYYTLGKTRTKGTANIQIFVDKDFNNAKVLSTEFFTDKHITLEVTKELETGITVTIGEKEYPVYMTIDGATVEEVTDAEDTETTATAQKTTRKFTVASSLYVKDDSGTKYQAESGDALVAGVTSNKTSFNLQFTLPEAGDEITPQD